MSALHETSSIRSYHAHVYFDPSTRDTALALREAIAARFDVTLDGLWDGPIGPHPSANYELKFDPAVLAEVVPWLMLNRGGLNILVHPNTDDTLADHTTRPLWLGTPVPLDAEFIRRYVETKRS